MSTIIIIIIIIITSGSSDIRSFRLRHLSLFEEAWPQDQQSDMRDQVTPLLDPFSSSHTDWEQYLCDGNTG